MKKDRENESTENCPENIYTNYSESGPCVYLVFSQGLVKIGRTADLKERLRIMKYDEFPHGVKGFGIIEETYFIKTDNPTKLEAKLHTLMEPEHVTGEWFHLKESDIQALNDIFKSFLGKMPEQSENLTLEIYTEEQDDDFEIPFFTY